MITVIALILVIIGSINWLSVGIFDFNIVNWMFSSTSYVGARVIYGIVGVAGLWALFYLIYNRFSAKTRPKPPCPKSARPQATDKSPLLRLWQNNGQALTCPLFSARMFCAALCHIGYCKDFFISSRIRRKARFSSEGTRKESSILEMVFKRVFLSTRGSFM